MDLIEFCRNLPKIELHAHLNGSLSEETLSTLNVPKQNIDLYQLVNSGKNNTDRLKLIFSLFKVAHDATNTIDSIYTATKLVIEEYHKDNVIYLELRTTPREEQNMSKKEYIEAIVKAINDQNLIVVKLLLSINRTHSLKESMETLQLIMEMQKLYPNTILGLDMSGNPSFGDFNEEIFSRARQNNLKITLHCGEIVNNEEIHRILQFKPDRIGHGTCIHPKHGGSKDNWELYKHLKIPLECCLTSNVLCDTVKSYKDHHVVQWIGRNLPFSINTDDKGIFSTNLSDEFFYAAENFSLSKKYLLDCNLAAVDFSFANNLEKELLKEAVNEWKSKYLEY